MNSSTEDAAKPINVTGASTQTNPLAIIFSRIFVGGLTKDTTADMLKGYFSYYGRVTAAEIMVNPETNKSRGFGFVTFEHPALIDNVLATPVHYLDGKQIDPKRFLTKNLRPKNHVENGNKKAFLGGIPLDMTEQELAEFFSVYGKVSECSVMVDEKTNKPRGFGFIAFEDESVIDSLIKQHHIEVKNKTVEVKLARPRSAPYASDTRATYGAPRYLTPSSFVYSTMEPAAKRMRGPMDAASGYGFSTTGSYGGAFPMYPYGFCPGDAWSGSNMQQNFPSGSSAATAGNGSKKSSESPPLSTEVMMKMMQQLQGGSTNSMSMMVPMMMSNMMFMQQFQTMFQNMASQQQKPSVEETEKSDSHMNHETFEAMKKVMQQLMSDQGGVKNT